MSDTYINYSLREKGHYELQNTPEQQSKNYLRKVFAILLYVSEKETEGTTFAPGICFDVFAEIIRRFKKHSHAFLLSVRDSADPMILEFLQRISHQTFCRVSYMKPLSIFADLIQYDKMILIPMENTWKDIRPKVLCSSFEC